MKNIRKAAEMALEVMEYNRANGTPNMGAAIEALRQALAQPEQEFVGACVTCGAPKGEWLVDAVNISQERVDETAKGEHEPFIYVREDNERPFGGYEHCSEADAGAFPVYTAPPKREWVGLTMQEYVEIENNVAAHYAPNNVPRSVRVFAQVLWETIEAKLKEKNT